MPFPRHTVCGCRGPLKGNNRMAMTPAIRAKGLGKCFYIQHNAQHGGYRTLRESLVNAAMAPIRRWRNGGHAGQREEFWALEDIEFEIQPGEVVGIIGRNGAGKSTLLKILSRITKPTTGVVELYGRVGSLLEVGTGFHPELTGRENIFLNGSILGMSRQAIVKRFDEIVAFAEIERFLDTPVKRYSSGMYVRLAFAVAAHLEPEVLLIDEVLAVGDASFQKKCLNKMQDVGHEGRTVLFVSHNMMAVTRLCPRAILLNRGRVIGDGPSAQITSLYLRSETGTTAARIWSDLQTSPGNEIVRLRSFRARDEQGQTTEVVDIRKKVGVEITFDVLESGHVLVPNFPFYNEDGVCVFHLAESDPSWRRRPRPVGRYTCTAWIPGNFLAEGTLVVGAAVSTMDPVKIHFYERDAIAFQVVDSIDGDSSRGDYAGPYPGIVRPLLEWSTEYHPASLG